MGIKRTLVVSAVALTVAVAVAAAALAGNGKGGGGGSASLTQAQAQAAMTAGSVSTGVATQQVSPAVVAAAAAQPGAVTLGVIPAPDGTVPATPSAALAPLDATAVSCWAVNSGWTWGLAPYNQHLNDLTYWCAHYNAAITTVTTTPSASSLLCDSSASGGQVIGGGVGYRYVDEQVNGNWACPTVLPYITLHSSHYLQTSHNSIGSSQQIGEG
jgi:hypothetical protein